MLGDVFIHGCAYYSHWFFERYYREWTMRHRLYLHISFDCVIKIELDHSTLIGSHISLSAYIHSTGMGEKERRFFSPYLPELFVGKYA